MNWIEDLNAEPKTLMEARQEAAMAQRVLNDAVFVDFLEQMQRSAANTALFDDKLEIRDAARVKVLTVAELKARLQEAARRPLQDAEDDEAAQVHE
jgi:hypothetical protein